LTINAGGKSRIFNILQGSVEIAGLTLANGSADLGGAIYVASGHLSLTDMAFLSNVATSNGHGGALYMKGNATTVTMTDSTFVNNRAGFGGAIFQTARQLDMEGVTFTNNTAASNGGSIYITGIGSVTSISSNTRFENNRAVRGGAIFQDTGMLVVDDSVFAGNVATGNSATTGNGGGLFVRGGTSAISNTEFSGNIASLGGGIFAGQTAKVDLVSVTLQENLATFDFVGKVANGHGGALYLADQAAVNISGTSDFANNQAGWGAGIFQNAGTLNGGDTVFTANIAANNGGAFYLTGASSVANFAGATLAGNGAVRGAGIFQDTGKLVVLDTLFSGNGGTKAGVTTLQGGGFYQRGGEAKIADATFAGNLAARGSAVAQVTAVGVKAKLTLTKAAEDKVFDAALTEMTELFLSGPQIDGLF